MRTRQSVKVAIIAVARHLMELLNLLLKNLIFA
jgi:hypothetical protein